MILTFQDTVERLVDFLGANPGDSVLRDAKRAAIEALRDLVQSHSWTYLYSTGRINLQPAFSDGTITYAASSGAYPNQVTLTGGMWPGWAGRGTLRTNLVNYQVQQLINGTTLTLQVASAPSEDITDPTPYSLFADAYTLPSDFAVLDRTFIPLTWGDLRYVHPREWLWEISRWGLIGNPIIYTITSDPYVPGQMCVKFAPFPVIEAPVDFLYKRHANVLQFFCEKTGTVSTSSNGNTVVGAGTDFVDGMAGNCVIRLSGNSKPPTAIYGDNPAIFESKIVSVDSATQLTTLNAIPSTLAGAPFTISSYVDLETGAMEQAYLRGCEYHISMSRIMKDRPNVQQQYQLALEVAKCADSRNSEPRTAGTMHGLRRRLKDYPINLNVEN